MNRITLFVLLANLANASAGDWPTWRGPKGDGIVTDPAVPLTWSATENVIWKVPTVGLGHSSPIVSGDRIFLTAFLPESGDRALFAYDRSSGKEQWRKTVLTAAPEKMHKNNTPASSTPAADGKHVWVTFLDGEKIAIACYDFAGERAWLKTFDGFVSPHGFCGTPILVGDLLIVNGDSDGDAFLAGLNKATGETVWRTPRPNRTRSFSAPVVIEVDGKKQLVVAGSKSVAALEPVTGKQLWVVDSATDKFVASPAYTAGLVFATGTSPTNTLVAIRPNGTGNVSRSHVAWSETRGAAYVPSPLGFGQRFFVLSDAGFATLLNADTGKALYSERLGSRLHHASPLLVNEHIYCLADDGHTFVLKGGDTFDIVATNALGEECHATPAIADGQLFIRSTRHLWCIGRVARKS